jgi:hypothetical protein
MASSHKEAMVDILAHNMLAVMVMVVCSLCSCLAGNLELQLFGASQLPGRVRGLSHRTSQATSLGSRANESRTVGLSPSQSSPLGAQRTSETT